MTNATSFLIEHGYAVIFGGVLAEQIGVPITSTPILLAAGALAGLGEMNLTAALACALVASLISDCLWFSLGRHEGARILKLLCRVSLEPEICISKTHSAYTRFGARSLLFTKFVPGLNALGPPMAGMSGLPVWKFILLDAGGTLAWAGSVVAIGWIFRTQLEELGAGLARFGSWAVVILVAALALYIAWKYVRRRRVYHSFRSARITPTELKRLMDAGTMPAIVDLRAEFERREGTIPGAIALTYDAIDSLPSAVTDREVVLYCSCPNEITAVRAALRLRRRGVDRVRPLEGGFSGWRDLGFPVDLPAPAAGSS